MGIARKWQVIALAGLMLALVWSVPAHGEFFFGTPKNLGPQVNNDDSEFDPAISADGLELYFQSGRIGGQGDADLYVSKRVTTNDEWGQAVNLGPEINSPAGEYGPSLSTDGLTLYFNSSRPGGAGGGDLYMSTRENRSAPWGEPVNLGPVVNTGYNEVNPHISADGLTLLFSEVEGGGSTYRPGGRGQSDLWVTTRASTNDPWTAPVNLGSAVNTGEDEGGAYLSRDGLVLFFGSGRADGNWDIRYCTRATTKAPWSKPKSLPAPVNTSAWDGCPEFSADGRTLYFTSSRSGTSGVFDLWEVSIDPIVDLNGDGKVDQEDARIIVNNWGTDNPRCDIGPLPFGDGVVDMKDLALLTQYASENVVDPTLLSCWKFDETEGNLAQDSVAGADAMLIGGPVWQPDAGAVGGAVALDGRDDCLLINPGRDPSKAPWSVFAWIKGGTPGQVILSQAGGANWLTTDSETGTLMTDLQGATRSATALNSQVVVTDGQWHRVGLTWDGKTRSLCVDGVVVAQDVQGVFKSNSGGLNIGCGKDLAPGTFWSGLIDDIRFCSRIVQP